MVKDFPWTYQSWLTPVYQRLALGAGALASFQNREGLSACWQSAERDAVTMALEHSVTSELPQRYHQCRDQRRGSSRWIFEQAQCKRKNSIRVNILPSKHPMHRSPVRSILSGYKKSWETSAAYVHTRTYTHRSLSMTSPSSTGTDVCISLSEQLASQNLAEKIPSLCLL